MPRCLDDSPRIFFQLELVRAPWRPAPPRDVDTPTFTSRPPFLARDALRRMDAGTSGPPPSFGLAGCALRGRQPRASLRPRPPPPPPPPAPRPWPPRRARVRSGGSPGAEPTPAARLGPPGPWVAASPRARGCQVPAAGQAAGARCGRGAAGEVDVKGPTLYMHYLEKGRRERDRADRANRKRAGGPPRAQARGAPRPSLLRPISRRPWRRPRRPGSRAPG